MRREISGILLSTEIIHGKMIRYSFSDCHIDLYIPVIRPGQDVSYRHLINRASIMINTPVTLCHIEPKPGVYVLQQIRYDQCRHTETIEEAKVPPKGIFSNHNSTYLIMIVLLAIAGVSCIRFTGLNLLSIAPDPLLFLLFAGPLIIWLLWETGRPYNKIIAHTTITEILDLSYDEDYNLYYRLADGKVVGTPDKHVQVGDAVFVLFKQNKNGTRGEVLNIIKIVYR